METHQENQRRKIMRKVRLGYGDLRNRTGSMFGADCTHA